VDARLDVQLWVAHDVDGMACTTRSDRSEYDDDLDDEGYRSSFKLSFVSPLEAE
jgi:hypothetical protein